MDETTRSLLIIFYRNPKLGKVKTRLAATVGNEKALQIFQKLALHTTQITKDLPCDKIVFYSDAIDLMDIWPNAIYLKALQQGDDLGERMKHALVAGFQTQYTSICIIGTDCYELTRPIILEGFHALRSADTVVGPARDGGYYLLGMKKPFAEIFDNKEWSTSTVLEDTIRDFERMGLQYTKLPTLGDIDTEMDLPADLRD